MYLSPSANYSIRRMLQEHVQTVGASQSLKLHVSESVNLNQLLLSLYPRRFEVVTKIRRLELLAELYRQMVGHEERAELRRRIFQILGFRIGIDEDVLLPPIVSDSKVVKFNFYAKGLVQTGIRFQGQLYGNVEQMERCEGQKLYQLAAAISEQNVSCVVTVSSETCGLWVVFRSPVYQVVLSRGMGCIWKVLSLHSALGRFQPAEFAVQ